MNKLLYWLFYKGKVVPVTEMPKDSVGTIIRFDGDVPVNFRYPKSLMGAKVKNGEIITGKEKYSKITNPLYMVELE